MKIVITAASAVLFATSASAASFYKDIGSGNPDLSSRHVHAEAVSAIQPSIGDSVDRYQGFGNDNRDVNPNVAFRAASNPASTDERAEVYVGPGLRF